jgi:hypothetical protein
VKRLLRRLRWHWRFGEIVRRQEALAAVCLGYGPWFDRLCWWLCVHGFIALPKPGPMEWRDFRWNARFWRGPFWMFEGKISPEHFDALRGGPDPRVSLTMTRWLFKGGKNPLFVAVERACFVAASRILQERVAAYNAGQPRLIGRARQT